MRVPRATSSKRLLSADSLERLALDFEIGFFERVLGVDAAHVGALEALGAAYTRRGRYRDGLTVDEKLVGLLPNNAVAHYNLACSLSLLGDLDRSLAALDQAIRLGYKDFEYLERDPDLENLRKDGRYSALVKRRT